VSATYRCDVCGKESTTPMCSLSWYAGFEDEGGDWRCDLCTGCFLERVIRPLRPIVAASKRQEADRV
jgi:hypothetical protein